MQNKDNYDHTRLLGLIQSLSPHLDFTNDEEIIKKIKSNKKDPYRPSFDETEILASFFSFLTEIKVMDALKKARVLGYRRVIIPINLLLLTYITKILTGVPSMNALPELLFSHKDLMRTIGFDESLLKKSISRRGEHGRSKEKKAPVPFSPQMLSNFIERFSEEEIELLFNSIIKNLALFGVFPKKIKTTFDAVDLKTTSAYQGCGLKSTTIAQRKGSSLVKTKNEYGFKLIALLDSETKIPLACKMLRIHEKEPSHLQDLIAIAKENIGLESEITHLTSNQSAITTEEIQHLERAGLTFYVNIHEREEIHEKIKEWRERDIGLERTININNQSITLTTIESSPLDDLTAKKINAVVIAEGRQKGLLEEKERVFLTNDMAKDPLAPFQRYNQESILKMLIYKREGQGWHLQKPPKKNERAMTAHVFMTMLTFGLTRAYREHVMKDRREG